MMTEQDIGARRRWTLAEKKMLVETAMEPGSSVAEVADCFGVAASLIYGWRKQMQDGELDEQDAPSFARVELAPDRPAVASSASVFEPGKIYLCCGYTDMRCGIDALSRLVQN